MIVNLTTKLSDSSYSCGGQLDMMETSTESPQGGQSRSIETPLLLRLSVQPKTTLMALPGHDWHQQVMEQFAGISGADQKQHSLLMAAFGVLHAWGYRLSPVWDAAGHTLPQAARP